MFYGDSKTGTYAKGNVGFDTATVAGIAMTDQAFGIINDTTNVVLKYDTEGIFGLGFPVARWVLFAVSIYSSIVDSITYLPVKFRSLW